MGKISFIIGLFMCGFFTTLAFRGGVCAPIGASMAVMFGICTICLFIEKRQNEVINLITWKKNHKQ